MRRRSFLAGSGAGLLVAGCSRLGVIGDILGRNAESFVRPIEKASFRAPSRARPDARLAAAWIGHATVLIQLEDKFVLTDPVFTDTVGQISKRLVEPGIPAEALPPIDAVVISHMHFDHLSQGSLELIEARTRVIYLPEGGVLYAPRSRAPTIELPSWQAYEIDGLRVTAVPVKHRGGRYGADEAWMKTSFTGYVIEYRGLSVYFGGDTGFTRAFRETARRFPRLDLAVLPIAPLHPRDFMCRSHLDPREALDAFRDLKARSFLAMHFDTFVNSLDEYGEAPARLRALLPKYGLDERRVAILKHGEQRVFVPR